MTDFALYDEDQLVTMSSLFDETATDEQKLVNGRTTGISNLNNTKYDWAKTLYRTMVGNHWIPHVVNMTEDKTTVANLDQDEIEALKRTLSFLIYLDSFQGNNLPNIAKYITAPAVANLLKIQVFQEVIHQESYQYILESLFPSMTRDEIYNYWRNDPILLKRIKFIADIGEQFRAKPSMKNFKRVIVANFILESVLFYSGFNFFDQLAHRSRLVQTAAMIDYIRTDEMTHMGIFANIILEMFTKADHAMIQEMFREACDQEIEWTHHVYGNRILGITERSSEEFVQWLGNDRLKRIHVEPIFAEVKNPYSFLADNTVGGSKRTNFFEASAVTDYSRADTVGGWDF